MKNMLAGFVFVVPLLLATFVVAQQTVVMPPSPSVVVNKGGIIHNVDMRYVGVLYVKGPNATIDGGSLYGTPMAVGR